MIDLYKLYNNRKRKANQKKKLQNLPNNIQINTSTLDTSSSQ